MKTARAFAQRARVRWYQAGGDIDGSVALLKQSRDAFIEIGLKPDTESPGVGAG